MLEVLSLTKPLWEIGFRATIGYFVLILLVRVIPKRNAGHISPNDLVTLIVIGGIGTDAVMGGSSSVGDLVLMIAAVILWAYSFDQLEYRIPAFRGILRDKQTVLIEGGCMNRINMRREMVTEEELVALLRKEEIDDLSEVKMACLEADGEISVIRMKRD